MKLDQWDLLKLGYNEKSEKIIIPEKIKCNGKEEIVDTLEPELFFGFNVEEIILPKSIKILPDGLCEECKNLKKIISSAVIIHPYTFYHSGLKNNWKEN